MKKTNILGVLLCASLLSVSTSYSLKRKDKPAQTQPQGKKEAQTKLVKAKEAQSQPKDAKQFKNDISVFVTNVLKFFRNVDQSQLSKEDKQAINNTANSLRTLPQLGQ